MVEQYLVNDYNILSLGFVKDTADVYTPDSTIVSFECT